MLKATVCTGLILAAGGKLAAVGPGDEYNGVKLKNEKESTMVELPVEVTVNESVVIKPWSSLMLGYNHNWMNSNKVITDQKDPKSLKLAADYLDVVKGAKLPLNRMSGTCSQLFSWKKAIGPYGKRKPMKLAAWVRKSEISRAGVVEWIQSCLLVDPEARFVFTVNMRHDTPQDAADLAEFLTGDPAKNPGGGFNWAALRVKYGLKDPVKIQTWELGNELDWGGEGEKFSLVQYIAKCREIIDAIKKVQPDASFAPHAKTAPWSGKSKLSGGWRSWHNEVLKKLGKDIDYLAFHPYYHGLKIPGLERNYINKLSADIKKITGSDRIKIFISEHAKWPPRWKNKPWRASWYQTHALVGCLDTAEFISRMSNRKDVAMMTYHCFTGGPWNAILRGKKTGQIYTTGIFDMFNLLCNSGGKDIVKSTVKGERSIVTKGDLTFTVTAITTDDGLTLILNNREPVSKRKMICSFKGKYTLMQSETLSAPDLQSYDTPKRKPIKTVTRKYSDGKQFSSYTVPAKSLVILHLKKI